MVQHPINGISKLNGKPLRTSQGLAQYVLDGKSNKEKAKVVIGYDGRHNSRRFADLCAVAFLTKGFEVVRFEREAHTPLVPFGVKFLSADIGVMITASHNPKDDNGYKVYTSSGCQINTPEDKAISESIMRNLEPIAWELDQNALITGMLDVVSSQYFSKLAEIVPAMETPPPVVYTPMHGVGLPYVLGALSKVLPTSAIEDKALLQRPLDAESWKSLSRFKVVQSQALPDPNFSSVLYPNPEEYGALDLAKKDADRLGIRMVLANDPDADRFALAQKLDDGSWYQFKGDEVGALLGLYTFLKYKDGFSKPKPLRAYTSAVSSQMLASIGAAEGFLVETTLTGFKWIGSRALSSSSAIFGYEEALGYMIPDVVHDKDGVVAAMLFLEACSVWKRMPFDVLQDIYSKYGYFETTNTYFKSPSLALTAETFETIRRNPRLITESFTDSLQCRIRDLTSGTDTAMKDNKSTLPSSPDNLMITLWLYNDPSLEKGVRCTIRASGTEPKIKGKES